MKRGFTRVELLVVLAVVALLIGVRLPALGRVQTMSKIAQCAANQKVDAMALQIFAFENKGKLPIRNYEHWVWDLSTNTTTALGQYGAQRTQMYDPGFPNQNLYPLWNYSINYRMTGYVWSFSLSYVGSLFADDVNLTTTASIISLTGDDPQLTPYANPQGLLKVDPSKRVLIADVVLSNAGQTDPSQAANYQWVRHTEAGQPQGAMTIYGPWQGASSAHIGNVASVGSPLPLGGNEAMLDGHVKWYPFAGMIVHAASVYSGPCFWWQADPGKL